MFTIFKKELKSYFRRAAAFYFVTDALALATIPFNAYNSYFGYSSVELILPIFSIFFALSIPILIMNIFSRDRKNGTDKLLYSLPFKVSDIVLGKYLTMLALLGIQVALISILPIALGFFGTVNYLTAYLSLTCFFFFGAAMLSTCFFIAASIKSKLLTVIISYAATAGAFLLYLVPTGASSSIWRTVAKAIRFLSPFSHLDNFAIGAIKITSLIYFVIFTALFLFLAIRAESKNRLVENYGKPIIQTKRSALSPVLAIILSVCTVVVSVGLSFLPIRFSTIDATSNKEISLSKATKDFLKSLDSKVDIYVINADGTNKQFEYVVELYDEYSSKINTKYVYQDDIADKLASHGWDGSFDIYAYTLLVESEYGRSLPFHPDGTYYYYNENFGEMDESTYQQYYQTLSQYAQAYPETYSEAFDSLVNETEAYSNAEKQLTMYIEHTSLKVIPGAYYVTGHGEPAPGASIFYSFLGQSGIEFKGTLDISSAATLPEDAYSLIINAPTSDLSSEEATTIKNFLASGGALTIITNEANLDMPNLMSILAHYGVSAKKGAVSFDYKAAAEKAAAESTEEESTNEESTEEVTYPDNDFVYAQLNTSHDSVSALSDYTAYYTAQVKHANHIEIASDLRASVKVTPLLTTDKDSFIEGVENSTGAKTIAVAIEETVGDVKADIAWYTGADSFDGEGIQMIPTYAATYSIIWGIDEPISTLGEIEPKLVSKNTPLLTGITKYLIEKYYIFIISPITYCYLKYRQDPFAVKKLFRKKAKDTEENTIDTEENTEE